MLNTSYAVLRGQISVLLLVILRGVIFGLVSVGVGSCWRRLKYNSVLYVPSVCSTELGI